MTAPASDQAPVLLGDEAVALGAIDAGISAAYAYPGTPSTEILEYLVQRADAGSFVAHWCANEKTAYEQALGVSMLGRRSLVAMKHVGLNVAADPFINSALVAIDGGLVVAVADDPGMHSSQNEQDSRYLADLARIICLEPSTQQEAYEMTREAFDLSERFEIPVMIRLTTRLCHGRAAVIPAAPRPQRPMSRTAARADWTLLPGNARRLWRKLLDAQPAIRDAAAALSWNRSGAGTGPLGVITAGIGLNSYLEALPELEEQPSHLHIAAYPVPETAVRSLADGCERILVIEEGYPFLERRLRGILDHPWQIEGKESGALPPDGELTPDLVRTALGLADLPRVEVPAGPLPARPPQLCRGCPHGDSYQAVRQALAEFEDSLVTSDIGCYTLGALPPYEAIESCVCMGASVGMAKGAADAGLHPVLAVIGDSTFLHSGVTPLMDVVAAGTPMTLLILDNETVAMTGLQPTVLPGSRLEPLLLGVGIEPKHLHVIDMGPRQVDELAGVLRRELEHRGPSVVVAVRPCVEKAKHDRRDGRS